jgi:tRNA G18 (ribose-2'-O)-methylase SpoU
MSGDRRVAPHLGRSTVVATITPVDDPADPRLDDYRDLTTADRRPDRPGGRGLVIAEGVVVVRRLLGSPYPVRSLLGVARRLDELADDLAALDVPAYAVDAGTMATAVGFHLNRGVLAVADRARPVDAGALARSARVLAVCEGVNDHENLGSLFRNAAALGVDGCSSVPAAPTRSTGAASASRWGTCCGCRSPSSPARGPRRSTPCAAPGSPSPP